MRQGSASPAFVWAAPMRSCCRVSILPNPDTPIQKLACPLLYLYGEDDGWITKADVQRLAAALKKYGKAGEIKIYPGAAHAFFRDTDPSVYRPEAAKDAWARAKAFFKQHLG
ncbi:MAG: hypothetical protein CV088_10400 [Nitrospira sp. LK70]|nr:hypothetical protein [Nitrospira sp. LK70]